MLEIDKKLIDKAWEDKSDDFYRYLYAMANAQVSKFGINRQKKKDYVQFAIYKCLKHQNSYNPEKNSSAYSFFWKQIYFAIAYKLRQERKKKSKINVVCLEDSKIIDWANYHQIKEMGEPIHEIVEPKEILLIKKIIKTYRSNTKNKLEINKENFKTMLKWYKSNVDYNIIDKFTTLKSVLKHWKI